MKKKSFLVGALLGLPMMVFADAKFTTTPLTIAAGETDKEVAIYLANDEDGGKSFQVTVKLPDGLYFGSSDYMTIASELGNQGWTLVKSQQVDLRDIEVDGVAHTHTWMFVGFKTGGSMPANVGDAATEDGAPILKFRVNAEDNFDAENAGQIDLSGAKLSGISGSNYDVDTPVEGVLKFNPDTNWINVDGGAQGVETTFGLTPAHTQTITFELHNDAPIRGLQGYIRLPKGLSLSPKAGNYGSSGNFDTTVRTEGDLLTIGTPIQEADGSWTIKFAAATMLPQFRKASEFGTALFTFDVVGNDPEDAVAPFDATEVEIVIDEFRANAGGGKSYVMDDVVKIKVTNDNQVAKDEKDEEIGQNTDAADLDGSLWAAYNAQVGAVDDIIENSSAVLEQEKVAREAIQALEHEVYIQYKAGTLAEWAETPACKELEAAAAAEIAKIADVAAETLVKAQEYETEAQKWIENEDELDVPNWLNRFAEITPIKDENKENAGLLKDAKDALAAALQDSKDNGLLGDNITAAGVSLAELETAVQTENAALATAIENANEAKKIEDGKAQAALDAPVVLLDEVLNADEKAYISQDDTDGTYADAWAIYEEKMDALKAAFGTDGTDGNVGKDGRAADLDVYAAEIADVMKAIDDVADAVEIVKAKAEANNAAAEQAKIDFALPANVAEDDSDGTFADAIQALDDAVAAAAEAGTQAQDDIYKKAIEGVKTAQETVIAKGEANKDLAEAALAEYDKYDYANDKYDGVAIAELEEMGIKYTDIMENSEVKLAVADYEAAKQALAEKMDEVEADGKEAWNDIYKNELDAFYAAEETLQNKILSIADVAKQNVIAASTALGTTVAVPEGTGKNDAYENIKGSEDLIAAETALTDAKNDLTDAIDEAKANGTLGDTPSPLADEIEAVEKAVEDLKAEYQAQSEQAAANYDKNEAAEAAAADFSAVKAENLDDVNESKIVKDAKAAFEAAQQAALDQYADMLDNNKTGDDDETKTLDELLQAMNEALNDYNEAIATANEAIEDINKMNDMNAILADDIQAELEKSKAQEINNAELGINNTVEYAELLIDLAEISGKNAAEIAQLRADFKNGDLTLQDVKEALAAMETVGVPADIEEAVVLLVDFLTNFQRGDVDGDGEFTVGDYLQIRKYIVNNNAPQAGATESQERYDFARADVNHDNTVDVGDARGAMNVAFYGKVNGEGAAEARTSDAESLVATANGGTIAIALNNSRQYCNMQFDMVLPEGMNIVGQELTGRMGKHVIEGNDLGNGIYRIVVTSSDIDGAIDGNEGELLYINVAGQGTVKFQNVILADMAAVSHQFQINGVAAAGATGIANVTGVAEGEQVYSLSGRMMNALKKGINIIRRADGSSQKVIKK